VNREGTLYTLTYGLVSSLSANPIEKKPLYHFYPGTVALTAGSYSCNFACPWCQNWHISKAPLPAQVECLSPHLFVERALERRCAGTSISFNEPTLSLEWSLDVFRAARERGLYNTYVTNGYMTVQALRALVTAGLDAMNVDIKGDSQAVRHYCAADVDIAWRNSLLARELGVHLEITTLVIPGVNGQDQVLRHIAERIVDQLGSEVPWHVTRYHPAYHYHSPPTPLAMLEHACEIGRKAGLGYVYLGNVPDHELQNTVCPDCGTLLVRRSGRGVSECALTEGRCPRCDRQIAGIWG
jgi:pyruvate formate lyase activating enzyme